MAFIDLAQVDIVEEVSENAKMLVEDEGQVYRIGECPKCMDGASSGNDEVFAMIKIHTTLDGEDIIKHLELVQGSFEEIKNAFLNGKIVACYRMDTSYVDDSTNITPIHITYHSDSDMIIAGDENMDYIINPDNTVELD